MTMKKHFLGTLILVTTFAIGLALSPIRFNGTVMGHGMVDDNGIGSYWIHGYESMYFVKLSNEGENYKTVEKAREFFEKRIIKPSSEEISEQTLIQRSDNRAVIHLITKSKSQGYCVIRLKDNLLESICSTSLWHVLDFEKQHYEN